MTAASLVMNADFGPAPGVFPGAHRAPPASVTIDATQLYRQHKDRVFHLCLRFGGGNAAWAEDATQDVFVKLMEHLDRLDDREDLGGWVYRVAANTCLTRLKREGSVWGRVRRQLIAEPPPRPATPERQVRVRNELRAALDALETLPPKERVVFSMRYLDDMRQQEIAVALSLSKGYVSKLMKRARAHLEELGWQVADEDARP